ncbi:hypothetical protein CVT26_007402 [Gymnopilus dilepis]|uniref:Uncharacterized protein n=1 Tax=Gymnopilus dilepis TaxID=231916 RepID=A0A409WQD2_9AGAR|nr:hypothetical protein CVT26_007402 [Gymnopilus dilepis]
MDSNNGLDVKNELYIREIRLQCTAEDAAREELDDLKLVMVNAKDDIPVKLTRVSRTMWRYCNSDSTLFPPKGILKFIATSDANRAFGHIQKDLSKCWGDIDVSWKLEHGVEDAPALSISLQICEKGPFQAALEEVSNEIDYLASLLSSALFMPGNEPTKPDRLNEIGDKFMERFIDSQMAPDINASIHAYEQALGLLSADDQRRPTFLDDAGLAFYERNRRFGAIDDINDAISRQQLATTLLPENDEDLPYILDHLGCSLWSRFQQTGNFDDVTESIQLHRRAVAQIPDGHPNLPGWLNNLGTSLSSSFERTDNLDDLAESIQFQQQAIALTPDGDPQLPARLGNLGLSFKSRFEKTGNYDDLTESIRLHRQVVEYTPEGHPHLAGRLQNLGSSLLTRFGQTGDVSDIAQSIQLKQRAVALIPEGHPGLPAWLNSLGSSFLTRFERTRDFNDLEQSIQLRQQAVELAPSGHPHLPAWLNNLGISFSFRSQKTGSLKDLERSIQLMRQAVEVVPAGHPDLPTWLSNLGFALSSRFEQTSDLNDLEQSIELQQQAMDLTPEGHLDFPARLNNLGFLISSRFEKTNDLNDLAQSIRLQQRAVELTPQGHPRLSYWMNGLGSSLLSQFLQTQEYSTLVAATSNFRSSSMSRTGPPTIRLQAARTWAQFSHKISTSEVITAHDQVINLISLVAGMENTSKRRYEVLRDSPELSTAAAAAALSVNQPAKALEWLEEGRCIVWNQLNQLRTPVDSLRAHHPDLADQLMLLSRQLEHMQARDDRQSAVELPLRAQISLETEASHHLMLSKEREQLLATIRERPGFESFFRPRKCADLMKIVPENGVVVVINSDKSRCDALVLTAGKEEPAHVTLEKFTRERAQILAEQLREYLASHDRRSRYTDEATSNSRKPGAFKRRRAVNQLNNILRALWTDLLDPILQYLGIKNPGLDSDLPRIWWCPTGPLSFLPIHAAGIYNPEPGESKICLANYVVSSYIPNLTVLDRLRSRKADHTGKGVLLVSQPNTPSLAPIPKTNEETASVCNELTRRHIDSTLYSDGEATVARIFWSIA